MGLIDSHAHLTSAELLPRLDQVLANCDASKVDGVITIGTDPEDTRRALELTRTHPTRIAAAGGIHPHEADRVTTADLDALDELWEDPGIVALGEMGLDYHYDLADRSAQKCVFSRQLEMAGPRRQPLIIHCRDAFDDVIPMLVEGGFSGRPVVFHCFTGGTEEALRVSEHGWRLSFTGIVTFSKSTALQEIAQAYPGDLLMIETDSPYLAPVPVRGKGSNEPANVLFTARFLATLRGVAFEQFVDQTSRNARAFFGLERIQHSPSD